MLVEEKLSVHMVAERIGVSYQTVYTWAKRSGVRGEGYTGDRLRRMQEANALRDERLAEARATRTSKVCAKCKSDLLLEEFYAVKGRHRLHPYCKKCCSELNKGTAQSRAERDVYIRRETFRAYGDACECCGETRSEFFTIDHIHGGGNKEREGSGGGIVFYRKLAKLGWPKDKYRLLCYNCHCSLGANGYCPHAALASLAA